MGINKFFIIGSVILILLMGVSIYNGITEPEPDLEMNDSSYEFISEINNEVSDNQLVDIEDSKDYINTTKEDMFSNTTELHWTHMPLIYNTYNCSQSNIDKINKATDFITNRTESITFKFNNTEEPDISFICMNERKMEYSNKYITNTLAEAIPYWYEELNIYAPSQILIYSVDSCPYSRPTTEIHEILHLLGLNHPKYAYDDDIMNPERVGCKADITKEQLEYLKSIYG